MKALTVAVAALLFTGCAAQQPDAVDTSEQPTVERSVTSPAGSTRDAVDAAVTFVCSGQRLLDTPPAELPEVVRGMWSRSSADAAVSRTIADLAALGERLAPGVGPTRFRQAALAVRIESFSDSRAEVAVWWVGVLSRSGVANPQAQWSTTSVVLVRESDSWKVERTDTEPGPLPDHSLDAEPLDEAEYERRLDGFLDWESAR